MKKSLKVLITNITLASRTGTETYVRDLAVGLLRAGHFPMVYSPHLGEIAKTLKAAGIPVFNNLTASPSSPDIIHAHHHRTAMKALLRFPKVPAVYVCHDRIAWDDTPPHHPRILRYTAVDDNVRERIRQAGIPEERIRVILNSVDMEKFKPRPPLPPSPKKALMFSNYAREDNYLSSVRKACEQKNLSLDVMGSGINNSCPKPEAVLGKYDIVFAKGRCALEALAVGCAVILCDFTGVGPLVTKEELEWLRRFNFGMRTLTKPNRPEILVQEIQLYDPKNADEVSNRIRSTAGLDDMIRRFETLYEEILNDWAANVGDFGAEIPAVASYLSFLQEGLEREIENLKKDVAALQNTRTMRLRNALYRWPLVRKLLASAPFRQRKETAEPTNAPTTTSEGK